MVKGTRFKIDAKTEFWLVTNPSPSSELGDVLTRCTIRSLSFMFRGGLSVDEFNPTIYSDREDACKDAIRRLKAHAVNEGRRH